MLSLRPGNQTVPEGAGEQLPRFCRGHAAPNTPCRAVPSRKDCPQSDITLCENIISLGARSVRQESPPLRRTPAMARPGGAARRFVVVAVVALAVVLPGASAYFRERFWHQVRKLTGSACPWRKDAGQELHRLLNNRIGGQIGAVEQLVDAVERWTVS